MVRIFQRVGLHPSPRDDRDCLGGSGHASPNSGIRKAGLRKSAFVQMNEGDMPRIPLEDNFTDVIGKAQRGYKLSDAALATKAGLTREDLSAIKGGEVRDHAIRAVAHALGLGGNALLALARREWYPAQVMFPRGFAMFNTTFGDMTVNSYLR